MCRDEMKASEFSLEEEERYDAVASQEEIYLEEAEVEVHEVLISRSATLAQGDASGFFSAENLHEELGEAAKELIAGDSDDPPLSEEAVQELLKPN